MKKYVVAVIFLLLFLLTSCSTAEQTLDRYFSEKNEIEIMLNDPSVSEKDEKKLMDSLNRIEKKIEKARRKFAVEISVDSIDLETIPFASEDADKIGEWFYQNIIFPLQCYEPDYASLSLTTEENFTSQEKFYIISYHLLEKYADLLTEKYSYLTLSAESVAYLSTEIFSDSIDSSAVMQYSSETDLYSVPVPTNDSRLLIPILGTCKIKDATTTEVSVNYAEQTLTKSIYSETFVFERKNENHFYLNSRVRNNQSVSLVGTGISNISQDEILILDLPVYIPEKITEYDIKEKSNQLIERYGTALDNYNGAIFSNEEISVSSLLHMSLLLNPEIDSLISDNSDQYIYFGVSPEYLEKQASYFFGNGLIDRSVENNYYEPLNVFIFKISDISRVSYHKQILNVSELDNGFIRLETALFKPSSLIDLIAKEVIIFAPEGNGLYQIFSRHYNMHTASSINVIPADIVPVYPEIYPDTSVSDETKGTWLYKNYGKLIDFEFDSTLDISSEKLAIFAFERLLETDDFKRIETLSKSFSFPKLLIEEQIRLYFGETDFKSEYVSFYDMESGNFFVNSWTVKENKTHGTVISTGSSEDNIFTVYVELPRNGTNDRMRPPQYVLSFSEQENGSFRFVSAQIS